MKVETGIIFIVVFIVIIITGKIVPDGTNTKWKNEADKKGYAEYYLDKDNNKQWRWKKCLK